mgnify:CR=1 FL=1
MTTYGYWRWRRLKAIDGFDFGLQPTLDEAKIGALAKLDFLRSAENVLFPGPSGTGKTHLSIVLCYEVLHHADIFSIKGIGTDYANTCKLKKRR